MYHASIHFGFDCETREEIDAVLAGVHAPDGSTVLVSVTESAAIDAPGGGGPVELPPQAMVGVPSGRPTPQTEPKES
jgi:hypothetical protein